jgi:hypothetical protein
MRRFVRSLALAQAVLAIAGCSAVPGAISSQSTSPAQPASPSPSPAAAVLPSPGVSPPGTPSAEPSVSEPGDSVPIPPDTYARVVTNDLRVRSKPGVSDDSEKLEPLLQEKVLVLVLDGPVQASGFDWYLVQPTVQSDTQEETYPFGWVAVAGKDGEPWLQADPFDCPPLPESVDQLGQLNQLAAYWIEIGCWAGQEITFHARVGSPEAMCGAEVAWGVEPAWFDRCRQDATYLVPVEESPDRVMFSPTWAPGVDTSIAGEPNAPLDQMPIVAVTGMFDHPAAQTCRNSPNYEDEYSREPDPARTIFECRRQFVVTSIETI